MPSRNRPGGTHQWRKQRARLIAAAGYRCCWQPGDDSTRCTHTHHEQRLELHHIIAVEDGGTDHDANLTPLCHTHHQQATLAQNQARRRRITLNPSRDW